MFLKESHYPFRKINRQTTKINATTNVIVHNYSFRGRRKRYIAVAEQYDYNVFAIKFYLQEKKSCAHKYNTLSNENEASRIITTMAMIMLDILQTNPYASYAFVGSPLPGEELNNTKRFKIYSRVVENLISPVAFEHKSIPSKSAYLMLNRHNTDVELGLKIEQMFLALYDFETLSLR